MHLWASHITPGGHYMRDYACASMNLRRRTANEKKKLFQANTGRPIASRLVLSFGLSL